MAALTKALELDKPLAGGTFPETRTFIPQHLMEGKLSIIPFTPHKKYLYHSGLPSHISMLIQKNENINAKFIYQII